MQGMPSNISAVVWKFWEAGTKISQNWKECVLNAAMG